MKFTYEGKTMKKVLFATTALVAFAGAAAADVSVSGSAEMGIAGGDGAETTFFQSVDIRFSMTGETDNGLSFGATVDADDLVDMGLQGNDPVDQGGQFADYSVFISGNFGTLTMGDTDGALDKAVAETDLIGDIADASTTYSVKSAAFMDGLLDGQVARYDYSIAGFGLSLSAETDDEGVDRTTWGFGATYSVAGYDFGAGYQGGEDQEGWMVSASTTFGAVDVVANYGEGITNVDGAVDAVAARYNIAMVYTMDALSLGANYGEIHTDGVSTDKGFGLAANYDLGGGLVLQAGYGEQTVDNVGVSGDDPINMYSLGLSMSF